MSNQINDDFPRKSPLSTCSNWRIKLGEAALDRILGRGRWNFTTVANKADSKVTRRLREVEPSASVVFTKKLNKWSKMMIYALRRKIDFVENLRVFGVKIWTEISIRVKNLTFSMSAPGTRGLSRESSPHPFQQMPANQIVSWVLYTTCNITRRYNKSSV